MTRLIERAIVAALVAAFLFSLAARELIERADARRASDQNCDSMIEMGVESAPIRDLGNAPAGTTPGQKGSGKITVLRNSLFFNALRNTTLWMRRDRDSSSRKARLRHV